VISKRYQKEYIMSYIKKHAETICWSCEKACGKCVWSSKEQPVPGWEAEETFIRNTSAPSYASYRVKSCPEYQVTVDFYAGRGEFFDLVIRRTGKSSYIIKAYPEITKAAFAAYSAKYPRHMDVPEEERNAFLTKCWEKEYEKMKKEKKCQKN
jgi:hypothetical protein